MPPIKTTDLPKIKEKFSEVMKLRSGDATAVASLARSAQPVQILVCSGTGCHAGKSENFLATLRAQIIEKGLSNRVSITITGCQGFCAAGPIALFQPEGVLYTKLTAKDVPELVEEHLINGKIVNRLLYTPDKKKPGFASLHDISFFSKQHLVAFRNRGMINPEAIDEYIGTDGYFATARALLEMTPEDIIKVMKESGLRGRGGGGYGTGDKWESCAEHHAPVKYMLCNADEGDPGAFMDRSILEGDPHAVIEGMIIGAKAIDAHHGYIYVRAEYPLAVSRLKIAIKQAEEYGLLGKNILGSGFDFKLELYYGAGAFVCGEATALMRSIEGKRGMPKPKPPHTAHKGLWGKPTILNNVETFANVPLIILNGSKWYSDMGTEKSKGSKLFAISGAVNNIGLAEVKMGTTLREIVYDIGGGIKNNRPLKAVQIGGPSGGCLPESLINTRVDYEELMATGAIMGSGGLVIMDDTSCMVDIAKFFLTFTVDESCGKCTPCRVGTKVLHDMLTAITEGKGKFEDLKILEDLSKDIINSSLCGLGQAAPNPVLTTIKYFREEYLAHIVDKKCPAGVCKSLISYYINDKCIGCTMCAKVCPVKCISGNRKEHHLIDQGPCIKCGSCYTACKFKAIETRSPMAAETKVEVQNA